MKKISFTIISLSFLILSSCNNSRNLKYLSGYWEISSVKKDNNKINIVGIHAVRVLLKVRPYDIYEIYVSDKDSNKFIEIFSEAKKNKISIQKMSNEIINNVKGVNRVVYDISSKPPATIEWE